MRTEDFDYDLPCELIAQHPVAARDRSRLLVVERPTGHIQHQSFAAIPRYLHEGDVLILNDSRVIRARLRARKASTGGAIEVVLLEENGTNDWWALLRPGKRVREGTSLVFRDRTGFPTSTRGMVSEKNPEGHGRIVFSGTENILHELDRIGEVPLPPYVRRPVHGANESDQQRYQTVYAREPGSIAAPTAGLHFTEALLQEVRARGAQIHYVTLHIGLGTFAPVKTEEISDHVMHEERFELSQHTADAINAAKAAGHRIFAVGTTTVRVLESVAAAPHGKLSGTHDRTCKFIFPPYTFRVVDALITNFHLPRSTLLMLVSAFAAPGEIGGRDLVLAAYAQAVRERYRFFSYGDAMLIL